MSMLPGLGFSGGHASSEGGTADQQASQSPYVPVMVSPTGLNLGEILQPLTSGTPENGGFSTVEGTGFRPVSSWNAPSSSKQVVFGSRGALGGISPWIWGGALVVGVGILVWASRG